VWGVFNEIRNAVLWGLWHRIDGCRGDAQAPIEVRALSVAAERWLRLHSWVRFVGDDAHGGAVVHTAHDKTQSRAAGGFQGSRLD